MAARCKSPLLFDLLEFSSDKKMYVHWRWRWMLKAQPSWSSGRSPALSEVSKRICKRCRRKNSESHNCNRERIVSGYFEHRVLTAPTRETSSCCRNSRQALRVAVVTVYLAENTTRSLDVFDQEEPPSAAVADHQHAWELSQLSSSLWTEELSSALGRPTLRCRYPLVQAHRQTAS